MNESKVVLATVNGIEITHNDVNDFIQNLDPRRAAQFQSEQGRKRILDEIINQKLFLIDAIENKIDKEEAFKTELDIIRENVLIQYSIQKIMTTVKVEQQELEDFYNQEKGRFMEPETVRASHILLEDEITANKVLKEINSEMSFEKAANTYSKCSSEQNGGDLGYFSRGKMVKEFEDVAFLMNIGEISKPVKTQFGYHLIKLVDKKDASVKSFDAVKEQLMQQVTGMKQNDLYISRANKLRGMYEVKMNE